MRMPSRKAIASTPMAMHASCSALTLRSTGRIPPDEILLGRFALQRRESFEGEEGHDSQDQSYVVDAETDGRADRPRDPQARRGGRAADAVLQAENGAAADEAHSGDQAFYDAGGRLRMALRDAF